MALWLVRAGRHGEYEAKFQQGKRIYLTWKELHGRDLSKIGSYDEIKAVVQDIFPAYGPRRVGVTAGQFWAFQLAMKPKDWVLMPYKQKSAIAIGEIKSAALYDPKGAINYDHYREVKWLADVPRSNFGQDLRFSLGSVLTICEIKRNAAEERIRGMQINGWKDPQLESKRPSSELKDGVEGETEAVDLEQIGRDAIANLIMAKFKGHGLARLVDAVLRAQGYFTYVTPPGADKGVDLLAAPEPLGFGQPRICVQVKSEQGPVDRPTLDQLVGTMANFHAEQGLLVAWGGFKASVEREIAAQFFKVRMWDQKILVDEILHHYDKLDAEVRAELPLKRIWTIATDDEEES